MKVTYFVAAALTALNAYCLPAFGQALELKGIKPGDPMEACPEGSRQVESKSVETLCSFGATTLADQEATDHVVAFHDGKVIAVMYSLKQRGMYANSLILEALKSKYGSPSVAKSHINNYTWAQGETILGLDGFKGTVMLMDRQAMRRAREAGANKSKSDL